MLQIHYYTIEKKNIPALRKWGQSLMNEYKEEALETLAEENSTMEILVLCDNSVIAINYYDGDRKPTNMERELNKKHCDLMKSVLVPSGSIDIDGGEVIYVLIR